MDDQLLELIQDIVFKVRGKKNLTYETDFVQDLALSSFDIMNIVCAFENLFDVEIPNRDVWQLHQVQDIINYIKERDLLERIDV